MPDQLTSAVGPGQPNAFPDVQLIQRRLNEYLADLVPFGPLKDDGRFGPKTAGAILAFQRNGLRMSNPDGIVDRKGMTFMGLTHQKPVPHSAPAHVHQFLKLALPTARATKAKWGVPIAVLLAQAAQETGWGRTVVNNAYFGIKGKSPSGGTTSFNTTEVIKGKVVHLKDNFRSYTSLQEAADDYGRFLTENPRYAEAFRHRRDPIKFAQAIAKAGYATDPNYAASLVSIIRSRHFYKYDE